MLTGRRARAHLTVRARTRPGDPARQPRKRLNPSLPRSNRHPATLFSVYKIVLQSRKRCTPSRSTASLYSLPTNLLNRSFLHYPIIPFSHFLDREGAGKRYIQNIDRFNVPLSCTLSLSLSLSLSATLSDVRNTIGDVSLTSEGEGKERRREIER